MEFGAEEQTLKATIATGLTLLASQLERAFGAQLEQSAAVVVAASALPESLIWWGPVNQSGEPLIWIGALGSAVKGITEGANPADYRAAFEVLMDRTWPRTGSKLDQGEKSEPPPNAEFLSIPAVVPSVGITQILFIARNAASNRLPRQAARAIAYADLEATLGSLLNTEIPFSICLGSTRMLLREVANLREGSVVELNRATDEPVEIVMDGRVMARGRIVAVQGNYAIQVTEVRESASDRPARIVANPRPLDGGR